MKGYFDGDPTFDALSPELRAALSEVLDALHDAGQAACRNLVDSGISNVDVIRFLSTAFLYEGTMALSAALGSRATEKTMLAHIHPIVTDVVAGLAEFKAAP